MVGTVGRLRASKLRQQTRQPDDLTVDRRVVSTELGKRLDVDSEFLVDFSHECFAGRLVWLNLASRKLP